MMRAFAVMRETLTRPAKRSLRPVTGLSEPVCPSRRVIVRATRTRHGCPWATHTPRLSSTGTAAVSASASGCREAARWSSFAHQRKRCVFDYVRPGW